MPSDHAFRLSTYLSLGLACLALGYAEWDLVPEAAAFTVLVVISLVASFYLEGRFALTIPQANRVGAVIAVLVVGWLGWRYFHPPAGLKDLHWPTGLLPYLGPLLMVLLPAKLFRPKHVGDWWGIQAVGAAAVGLACAVADDAAFAVLLALYLVAATWSAALFVRLRWAGAVAPVPGYPTRPAPILASESGGHPAAVLGWLALAAAVAVPAFFLTPRSPAARWQIRATAETGYTGDRSIDLTTTGTVQVSRSVAFTVEATNADGSPKTDLDPHTFWRGQAFVGYDKGKWTLPTTELRLFRLEYDEALGHRPAAVEPDGFTLTFHPDAGQVIPVLAAPVYWTPRGPTPVASLLPDGRVRPWDQETDGSFALPLDCSPDPRVAGERKLAPYRQVTRIVDPEVGGPGFVLDADGTDPNDGVSRLRELPVEGGRGIRAWADEFLAGLIRAGKLPPDAVRPAPAPRTGSWVRPEYYLTAAGLFRNHFAESGEFNYALDLRRSDKAVDPVEDFLRHEKAGHCQRFASALALTLRAVGVPCSLVIGFKGFHRADGGKYLIRQEHAHAWVNVLVLKPNGLWRFRIFDPTPVEPAAAAAAAGETWIGSAQTAGREFYSNYVVGYDPDRRKEVLDASHQHISDNGWHYLLGVVGIGVVAGAVGLVRAVRRPGNLVPAIGTGVGWYDAVVDALAAAGHPVRPGQTPGEHATEVAGVLRADPRTAGIADIPTDAAAALYEVRYAGRPLTAERLSALAAAAERLAGGLRSLEGFRA